MQYRKKPVVVEAVQYNNLNREEIENFVGKKLNQELESETAYLAGKGSPKFSVIIPTLEGDMKAMPGDWVIKGVIGEFYPCKPDIFEKTYDPADKTFDTLRIEQAKERMYWKELAEAANKVIEMIEPRPVHILQKMALEHWQTLKQQKQ